MGHIDQPSSELGAIFDPLGYGFEVITQESLTREEERQRIASLYRNTLYHTGMVIPQLEEFLYDQTFDPEPARRLADRHAALPDPYECRFGQANLSIDRDVFCPTLTNVSPFLLQHVTFGPHERVLDAFTGSGAFAINAALAGSTAVGYDISPAAVTCATKNTRNNHVSDQVDIRQGTLHEAILPGEQFDMVIANPPLIPGDPGSRLEQALFDTNLSATKEFIAALPVLLAKKGHAYIITSDVIERRGYEVDIAKLCRDSRLSMEIIARLEMPYESYRVHHIQHSGLSTWIWPLLRKSVAYFSAYPKDTY